MNSDWQSFAAPAAVLVTLGVFAWRWLRRPSSGSCAGCACAPKVPKPAAVPRGREVGGTEGHEEQKGRPR